MKMPTNPDDILTCTICKTEFSTEDKDNDSCRVCERHVCQECWVKYKGVVRVCLTCEGRFEYALVEKIDRMKQHLLNAAMRESNLKEQVGTLTDLNDNLLEQVRNLKSQVTMVG